MKSVSVNVCNGTIIIVYGVSMTLLWLFLFICVISGETINCHDEDDYYHFMYNICSQSLPCKHLFHLYPLTPDDASHLQKTPERSAFIDYRNDRDYQLFRHQLLGRPILPQQQQQQQRIVLHNTMPDAWLPTTSVLYKQDVATPRCSEDTSLHNPVTVMTVLYAMHIYKLTVSDDFFCHDPNERLFIDPVTNDTICVCKTGKVCDNDSNFDELFTFLLVILIFGIVAFIITIFVSLFYKRSMIYDLWGTHK